MFTFDFKSFGRKVRVQSPNINHIENIGAILTSVFNKHLQREAFDDPDHTVTLKDEGESTAIFLNSSYLTRGNPDRRLYEYVESRIRIEIAENAGKHIFVHAGVVAFDGTALILPAKSYSGKSTLVHALVEAGATYLSDEYAVFDTSGMLVSFPKPISIRSGGSKTEEIDIPAGQIEQGTLLSHVVLFTSYEADAEWQPTRLSPSEGMLKMLEHTVPARKYPERSLKVLGLVAENASFYFTPRPDIKKVQTKIRELVADSK